MKRLSIIFLLCCIYSVSKIYSQAIHFSQTENIPLLINAAQAGIMPSDYRIGINYRIQSSVNGDQYKTYNIWGDIPFGFPFLRNGFFGLGVLFSEDNTQNKVINVKQFEGKLSYHHKVAKKSWLSLGINYAYSNIQFKSSNLVFEDQWTGLIYDGNVISQDNFLGQISYTTLGVGLNYTRTMREDDVLHLGFYISNLNKPTKSLTDKIANKIVIDPANQAVPIRYTFYANYLYRLNDNFFSKTIGYFNIQGSAMEAIFGNHIKYQIYPYYAPSISAGIAYRYNSSIIFLLGYEQDEFQIGISYDANYASSKNFLYFSNALELSAIFNLGFFTRDKNWINSKNRIQCKF